MSSDITLIELNSALKGAIVPADLLRTEATIHFVVAANDIAKGGFIFQVKGKDFVFALSFQNNCIVIERNEAVSILNLDKMLIYGKDINCFVSWSFASLVLDCGIAVDKRKRAEVNTEPIAPPVDLLRWARKQNLIDTPSYTTEEDLREKVYSCLNSINEKIREADAFKTGWNISYSGNTIISRKPKQEVELQPWIHSMLLDQMLQSNIEIIPEYKTGEGNIDFTFIGNVEGKGLRKICAEFKLAHSNDLEHGLLEQLPAYMRVTQATYGAYCVLNFKGEWFDKPKLGGDQDLEYFLALKRLSSKKPVHENIRNFVFHLAKPATASKK